MLRHTHNLASNTTITMQNKPVFLTPEEAEAAFYQAMELSDLDAMMQVWAQSEDIVFVPPGGPRFKGTTEVREVWRQILSSGSRLRIRTSAQVKAHAPELAVHSSMEYVTIDTENSAPPVIVSTSVYIYEAERGWRLLSQHSSPTPQEKEPRKEVAPSVVLH